MTEQRATEILIVVAKKFLKRNTPSGVMKLSLSDHQFKMVSEIQEAINVFETQVNQEQYR